MKKHVLIRYFAMSMLVVICTIEWLCIQVRAIVMNPRLKRNVAALSFLSVFIFVGSVGGLRVVEFFSPTPIYYENYVVQSGDSLFAIGSREFNGPTEQAVYLIKTENGLTSSLIHPGQILKIPKIKGQEK
ncbi:LysM peptidoglycan-binding domain-containing protein [Paenibacillus sp. Leaf72]|uniref:LysM peptidoglycan-binding domain-containing protein n=1 Tax=Paenibacillus sp. Leaf72 TaxID=1736234 RepID=UPI0006FD5A25|nr:LysM peptidoglycan-binding domain-containing protein [Paenibacillus sp. Leaf72]KQN96855.1 hypothetical protein ASF12_22565 [Paenibacillus sp. Leaf72]